MKKIIETERMNLRPFTIEDRDAIFKMASNPLIGPACGWNPHRNVVETELVLKNYLMVDGTYALERKEDGRLMGCISLTLGTENATLPRNEKEGELGFWIGREYWGHGYMPEAGKALINYGFRELLLKEIWAGYFEGNNNSRRAQEKMGLTYRYTIYETNVSALKERRNEKVSSIRSNEYLGVESKKEEQKDLHLIRLLDADRKEIESFMEEVINEDNYEGTSSLFLGYDKWLELHRLSEVKETVPHDRVKSRQFVLVDEKGYIYGTSGLRYETSSFIENEIGHIGYFIRKSERGKGFGKLILREVLRQARSYGMKEIIITAKENNKSSISTAMSLGGVYADSKYRKEKGEMYRRYIIPIK